MRRRRDRVVDEMRKVRQWAGNHPARGWSLVGVVVVAALWGGTQIARSVGQDVRWYSAFGSWLGVIASIFAAGTALWIATSDRRREDARRTAERDAVARDLAREAGLVRVDVGYLTTVNGFSRAPGLGITNWRVVDLVELEIVRLVVDGAEVDPVTVKKGSYHPIVSGAVKALRAMGDQRLFDHLVVSPRAVATAFPGGVTTFAAVRYTDMAGRRWEVDSESKVARPVE